MPEGVAQVDGVALGCEGACVDDGLGVARDGFGLGLKLEPRPKPILKMEPRVLPSDVIGLGLKLEPRPIYIDEGLMPIPLITVAHAHFKLAHNS